MLIVSTLLSLGDIPVMQPKDWIKRRYFQVGHVAAISSKSMYGVMDAFKIIVTGTTVR
jgi:hypothetical protein